MLLEVDLEDSVISEIIMGELDKSLPNQERVSMDG